VVQRRRGPSRIGRGIHSEGREFAQPGIPARAGRSAFFEAGLNTGRRPSRSLRGTAGCHLGRTSPGRHDETTARASSRAKRTSASVPRARRTPAPARNQWPTGVGEQVQDLRTSVGVRIGSVFRARGRRRGRRRCRRVRLRRAGSAARPAALARPSPGGRGYDPIDQGGGVRRVLEFHGPISRSLKRGGDRVQPGTLRVPALASDTTDDCDDRRRIGTAACSPIAKGWRHPDRRVATHTAGRPVSRPRLQAMKAADPSWRVATTRMRFAANPSSNPMTLSPGTVKAISRRLEPNLRPGRRRPWWWLPAFFRSST